MTAPSATPEFHPQHYVSVVSSTYIVNFIAQVAALRMHINENFMYHVLCMDSHAYKILHELGLENIFPVFIEDFENDSLRQCKSSRTLSEYCWTVKPPFLLHILEHNTAIGGVTFLDADIYPFCDLDNIWSDLTKCDIILYPHNFIPELDYLNVNSGKYNAGMISVKNTENGRNVLNWWTNQCIDWCFLINEKDRLGDQKYLLRFQERFEGIMECSHRGINVGPWGINMYSPFRRHDAVWLTERMRLILYHFHQYKYNQGDFVPASDMYPIPPEARDLIYTPYTTAYGNALRAIRARFPMFTPPGD